jgi:hypothetical protein
MRSVEELGTNWLHHQSKSGSQYHYTSEGVYRYSNHWGRVANCRWKIKGIADYKNQEHYLGYASWNDFYPLNDIDKVFYIKVDLDTYEVQIHRNLQDEHGEALLMRFSFAQQRLRHIKHLLKDTKWTTYYEEDITSLREKLIHEMITTSKPLQQIKRELRYK